MEGTTIKAAFVATNSVCQGQQVYPLWKSFFEMGIHINFAYTTFLWKSEAHDNALVYVVIIGFSYVESKPCFLYDYDGMRRVNHINGYLAPAPDAFVERRAKPICDVKPMVRGCGATDGGNLILSSAECKELIFEEPEAAKWIRPFSMGEEFIKGKDRYCLWLVGATETELHTMPLVWKRIEAVRQMRFRSAKKATQRKASTPWLFDEVRPPKGETYLVIPKVTSSRRFYVPIGFISNGLIPGDMLFYIDKAGLFEFGVMTSQFHNAWMRQIASYYGPSYRYSNTTVYNNFIWPGPTPEQKVEIERLAQSILDIRGSYPGKSLANLYDPDKMPLDLLKAHKALDRAVEAAYGVDFNGDEEKIVAHLFKLYAKANRMHPS